MDLVIVSVAFQMADCLLPVGCQDVLVLSCESLVNLEAAQQSAIRSAEQGTRRATNVRPGTGV